MNGNLFKVKTDGTNKTRLSSDDCHFVNVIGNSTYYCNSSDNNKVYRIVNKTKTRIIDNSCSYLNVVGDWIYYINDSDNQKIYRAKINGEEKTSIINEKCTSLNVSGDWMYYSIYMDDNIHKAKIDGTGQETILVNFETSTPCLSIFGDWIYYFSSKDGYKICKIKTDGTSKTVLK